MGLQGTFCIWTDAKVYFKQRPMRERRECKMQNFISFLMALIFFENFRNFSLGIITSLSNNCPWQVTLRALVLRSSTDIFHHRHESCAIFYYYRGYFIFRDTFVNTHMFLIQLKIVLNAIIIWMLRHGKHWEAVMNQL